MQRTTPIESSEPVWDLAELFPHQGAWTEEDYLALETNHLIEYSHGRIEVLPMPTEAHQLIVLYLRDMLKAFLSLRALGLAIIAPLKVRLWPNKFREPDVAVLLIQHAERRHQQYWDQPDLVMEVVSPDNRQLDIDTKRREYARAGIPEYWIVDPEGEQITVLTLQEDRFAEYGVFKSGEIAQSKLLAGFEVNVASVWAATKE
jgi:Uma2 family endonuclease